ncbi:unnamed protein product, partial [Staurois parvus]
TKQHSGADRGEICIVYIQTSPPSVIVSNRWVPVGNLRSGPGDRQLSRLFDHRSANQ